MADVKKINGYNIKDEVARNNIITLETETDEKLDELDYTLKNEITTKINMVQSEVNDLSSEITSLQSGSPIPVDSVQAMADTNKTYLNTSDGNWYYYNGTTWVVGGTYQATQISNNDTAIDGRNTQTSKLALFDGYEKLSPINDLYNFEYGDITGNTGSAIGFADNVNHLRMSDGFTLNVGEDLEIINMSNGALNCRYFEVDEATNNIITASNWTTGNYTFHGDNTGRKYYMYAIGSTWTTKLYANDLAGLRIRNTKITRQNYLHSLFEANVLPYAVVNGKTVNSATRCLTDFIDYDGKIKVKCSNNIEWIPIKYDKTTKVYIQDALVGWQTTGYFTFDKTYLYKIVFRYSNNSNILPKNVIDGIKIYPVEQSESSMVYNLPNIILNNHQGYSDTTPYGYDLAENYYNAFLQGYKNVETDIKFTSDNIPVCSHDASFISGGNTIVIAENTYSQLLNYDFHGSTISSLDDVLKVCKNHGLILQLDQLDNFTDTQWNNIFSVIKKYQMQDYVIYSTPSQNIITKILSFDNSATCCINVINYNNITSAKTLATNNLNGKNKFIIMIDYNVITSQQLLDLNDTLTKGIYAGVWTIDNIDTFIEYLPYSYMITTNKITPSDVIDNIIE